MSLILFVFEFFVLGSISFLAAFFYFLVASHFLSYRIIEHPLSMLAIGVATALILRQPLRNLLKQMLRGMGFREEPEGFRRLRVLVNTLLFEQELVSAANLFVNSITEEFKLSSSALFLQKDNSFSPTAFSGRHLGDFKGFLLSENSPLIRTLRRKPEGLKGLGPREPLPKKADSIEHDLFWLRAAYVFPLFHGQDLFGFLSLGFRGQGIPTRQEIRFIRSLLPLLSAVFFKNLELDKLRRTIHHFPDIQSEMLQSAKLSALEQLATGIAHEIHNPLTIISGKAQVLLLKKSKEFNAKLAEEVLQAVVHQAKRASEVTRKLLMFTRSNGREKGWIDLEGVLKDTLSLISYQLSLEQVRLEKQITPNLPKYWGSDAEIREIFMNLILNAIQATPPKGWVRISLRKDPMGNKVQFCVEDSGKGIPKEEMPKIFDPFYTSLHGNLGLGLYITERLAFKNGGKIHAESEEGKGSLFLVELPLQKVPQEIQENTLTGVI